MNHPPPFGQTPENAMCERPVGLAYRKAVCPPFLERLRQLVFAGIGITGIIVLGGFARYLAGPIASTLDYLFTTTDHMIKWVFG